jgi:large subunit ribosomal protein L4
MKKENINISPSVRVCTGSDFGIVEDIVVASPTVISQSVRVHLQNSRQGTVACKGRAELVSRSNKKPWRQKGTGKARAGSPRSPLWRGGGVCFGPQARTRVLSISKKMNRAALKYLFLDLLDARKIMVADMECSTYSTKHAKSFLKANNLDAKRIILLHDMGDFETYYSFANLPNITMVSFDSVYSYVIANDVDIMYLKRDEARFKDVVNKWLM